MSLHRRPGGAAFVVPLAAAIGLAIALLVAGAFEFVRVLSQDMALIRSQAEAQPALQSGVHLAALLLRASRRDSRLMVPDAVLGSRLMGIKDTQVYFDGTPTNITILDRAMQLRIQDETGLAPINGLSVDEVRRVLIAQGVQPEIAQRFAAEAADFRDYDDDRQAGGAEREDYLRQGLPAPKNRAFNHLGELGLLLSAPQFQQSISRDVIAGFGFDRSSRFNINAASSALLMAAFDFTEASANRLVQDRRRRPIEREQISSYPHRLGAFLEQRVSGGPSDRFRIEVVDLQSGAAFRRTIVLDAAAPNQAMGRPDVPGVAGQQQAAPILERETVDLP